MPSRRWSVLAVPVLAAAMALTAGVVLQANTSGVALSSTAQTDLTAASSLTMTGAA